MVSNDLRQWFVEYPIQFREYYQIIVIQYRWILLTRFHLFNLHAKVGIMIDLSKLSWFIEFNAFHLNSSSCARLTWGPQATMFIIR